MKRAKADDSGNGKGDMPVAAAITFVVPGAPAEAGATRGAGPARRAELARGKLKHSVRVMSRRGDGGNLRVSAVPGDDVVVLHIAGGPSLTLHPENARDLILAQNGVAPARGARGESIPDEVPVPVQLQWR